MSRQKDKEISSFSSISNKLVQRISNSKVLGIVDFIYNILGFDKELFLSQRALLKCICDEPLSVDEEELLRKWKKEGKTNWEPGHKWLEINIELGMRSSKTVIAAWLCCYTLYKLLIKDDPLEGFPRAAKGTTIFITTIATTETQSKDTIYGYIKNFILNSPWFQTWIKREELVVTQERIYSETKNVVIYAGHSNGGALVGKGSLLVCMDEVCRFIDVTGSYEKVDGLVSSLSKSLSTFAPESKRIAISSAWESGDYMEKLVNEGWDRVESGVLCFRVPTFDFRPDITKDDEDIKLEYIRDPVGAARDYECIRPKSTKAFFDEAEINYAISIGGHQVVDWQKMYVDGKDRSSLYVAIDLINITPVSQLFINSYAHADPGISGDAYAFAVGHFDEDAKLIYIDALLRWAPEKVNGRKLKVSFTNVEEVITTICKKRRVVHITFDHFQAEGLVQNLLQEGIRAESVFFSRKKQAEIYLLARRWINQRRVILPKYGPLVEELRQELIHIGYDGSKITHPPQYGKDLSDAVCTVIATLAQKLDLDVETLPYAEVQTVGRSPSSSFIKPIADLSSLRKPRVNSSKIVREFYNNGIYW